MAWCQDEGKRVHDLWDTPDPKPAEDDRFFLLPLRARRVKNLTAEECCAVALTVFNAFAAEASECPVDPFEGKLGDTGVVPWQSLAIHCESNNCRSAVYHDLNSLQAAISDNQAAELLERIRQIVPKSTLNQDDNVGKSSCQKELPEQTNGQGKKRKRIIRDLTPAAKECIERYREYKRQGDRQSMKYVAKEYVYEHPGEESESGLYRRLTDHSPRWKRI